MIFIVTRAFDPTYIRCYNHFHKPILHIRKGKREQLVMSVNSRELRIFNCSSAIHCYNHFHKPVLHTRKGKREQLARSTNSRELGMGFFFFFFGTLLQPLSQTCSSHQEGKMRAIDKENEQPRVEDSYLF